MAGVTKLSDRQQRAAKVAKEFVEDGGDLSATPVAITLHGPDGQPEATVDLVATRAERRAAAVAAGRPTRQRPSEFAQLTPREWLVDDLIPAGAGLVLIYGESTAGKSYWTLDLVAAIARGADWRDKPTRKTRVLSVVAEGASDYRFRVRALAAHLGCELDELPDVYAAAPDLLSDEQFAQLLAEVRSGEIVTLDTLNATMLADENSSEAMGRYIARVKEIHGKTGRPVFVLHHPGKDLSKGARGHSSLHAAADVEITITKQGTQRAARVSKLKDGVEGASYAFTLEPIVLGADDKGKTYGAAIVKHSDAKPRASRKRPRGQGEDVLKAMDGQGGPVETSRLVELVAESTPRGGSSLAQRKSSIEKSIRILVRDGWLFLRDNDCLSLISAVEIEDSDGVGDDAKE